MLSRTRFRGWKANPILNFRREARQPRRKVRQLERIEQDVLHTGKEAELVLRCHVNAWVVEAYELDGFARSICAAFGWVKQRLFSPQETLRTFRLCTFALGVMISFVDLLVRLLRVLMCAQSIYVALVGLRFFSTCYRARPRHAVPQDQGDLRKQQIRQEPCDERHLIGCM